VTQPVGRRPVRFLQDIESHFNSLAFAVGAHGEQGLILQIAVAGDIVAGAGESGDASGQTSPLRPLQNSVARMVGPF